MEPGQAHVSENLVSNCKIMTFEQEQIRKARRAALAIIIHVALLALILVTMKGIELLTHWLWSVEEYKIYDRFPLRYIFDTIDTLLIAIFGYMSFLEAYLILQGKDEEETTFNSELLLKELELDLREYNLDVRDD
jgi:hypothetical protein